MYAVFRTGGKQYKAAMGDKLKVERLSAAEGDKVEFAEVLLVGEGASVQIGNPLVSGSKVKATVLSQAKDKKVEVIKFKRRQNYRRTIGHRQPYTLLEITGITGATAKKATAKSDTDTAPVAAKKATAKKAAAKKVPAKKAAKKTAKKTAAKSAGKATKE